MSWLHLGADAQHCLDTPTAPAFRRTKSSMAFPPIVKVHRRPTPLALARPTCTKLSAFDGSLLNDLDDVKVSWPSSAPPCGSSSFPTGRLAAPDSHPSPCLWSQPPFQTVRKCKSVIRSFPMLSNGAFAGLCAPSLTDSDSHVEAVVRPRSLVLRPSDLVSEIEAAALATEMALQVLDSDDSGCETSRSSGDDMLLGGQSSGKLLSINTAPASIDAQSLPHYPSSAKIVSVRQKESQHIPTVSRDKLTLDAGSTVNEDAMYDAGTTVRRKGRARMSQEKRRRLARRKEREALLAMGVDAAQIQLTAHNRRHLSPTAMLSAPVMSRAILSQVNTNTPSSAAPVPGLLSAPAMTRRVSNASSVPSWTSSAGSSIILAASPLTPLSPEPGDPFSLVADVAVSVDCLSRSGETPPWHQHARLSPHPFSRPFDFEAQQLPPASGVSETLQHPRAVLKPSSGSAAVPSRSAIRTQDDRQDTRVGPSSYSSVVSAGAVSGTARSTQNWLHYHGGPVEQRAAPHVSRRCPENSRTGLFHRLSNETGGKSVNTAKLLPFQMNQAALL